MPQSLLCPDAFLSPLEIDDVVTRALAEDLGRAGDVTSIAGEVRNPEREIPRSLALGTALVTALYVLVNAGLLHVLSVGQIAASTLPAALSPGTASADSAGDFSVDAGTLKVGSSVGALLLSSLGAEV